METHLRSEETLPDFGEEMLQLISPDTNNSSSFTALLELPPTQAVELLHSPESEQTPAKAAGGVWGSYPAPRAPVLPANAGLLERASRLSVFAARREDLSEPLDDLGKVKREPSDFDGSGIDPNVSSSGEPKVAKRKDREKGKDCKKKKSKTISNGCNDGDEKLPYVHVRARRGQATDSHSLAERARREKINARMKLLQELVPGCNKISGTAMVLDEIINHVQSLQRQVEFLSMRLASVNPRIDFDVDSLLAAQANNPMDSNYHGMVMPLMWPDGQLANMTREQQQYPQLCHFEGIHIPEWGREEKPNFITPDNSLLSYVSPTNSGSLHLNHLKKET